MIETKEKDLIDVACNRYKEVKNSGATKFSTLDSWLDKESIIFKKETKKNNNINHKIFPNKLILPPLKYYIIKKDSQESFYYLTKPFSTAKIPFLSTAAFLSYFALPNAKIGSPIIGKIVVKNAKPLDLPNFFARL